MSLKNTETLYNLVIENVIKEISEDPQMSSVSTEALDYLGRVWKNKLNESGVFTPHPSEYQRHVGNAMLPIRPSPGGQDYMASMNNQTMDPQTMAGFYQQRFFPPFNQHFRPDWIPPQGNPAEMQMFPGHYQNIMFDAKPTLVSGNQQHPMNPQMLQHYNMGMGMPPMNAHPGNVNDKMKQNQKEPSKTTINIKGEDSEEQNNSKLPVKVPTNGDGKGLIDVSTGTPRTNATSETPGATNKPAEKEKPVQQEEEKKNNDTNEDADDEQEDEAQAQEEDDEDLFEYNVDEKKDVIQTKEEHIPPPLQQNTVAPAVNLSVTELDPYNPQDRPLDSDDDPDYAETPDTTDILLAFHEKVHRHGSKWKVTLKQGIMNARGKEYILSQITGDFDFM